MERRTEGPQTPYEVYCHHCHVSFAAGTSRCIHCGRRLGGRAKMEAAAAPEIVEDVAEQPGIGRRLGGMSLWILVALGAVLTRICGEGGG